MMKRVIDRPQTCDMGSGFGHIEFDKALTLGEALDWIETHSNTWGKISIFDCNGEARRRFDYNTYSDSQFYHHMSGWEYKLPVEKIKFEYCFMSEDIQIYLGRVI